MIEYLTPGQVIERYLLKDKFVEERDALNDKIKELETLQEELKHINHVLELVNKVTEIYRGKPIYVGISGEENCLYGSVILVTESYPHRYAQAYVNMHTATRLPNGRHIAKDWCVRFSTRASAYAYSSERVYLKPLTLEEAMQMSKDYVVTGEFPEGAR